MIRFQVVSCLQLFKEKVFLEIQIPFFNFIAERLFNRQCESYPQAICINNYCGGCVAQHYVDSEEVFCGKGGSQER